MAHLPFCPAWFSGFDIILQSVFAIVSLLVSLLAFRVHRATSAKPARMFGLSFLAIGLSYLIQALFNLLVWSGTDHSVCASIEQLTESILYDIGLYSHMALMTAGLALLAYMTFRVAKARIYLMLLSVAVVAIITSRNPLAVFAMVSSVLLAFIAWHFIGNWREHRSALTLLVAAGFLFMLVGEALLIFTYEDPLFYAVGHLLEMVAYLLMLANLILVIRNHG
ncbi:hypothetical protein JXB02_01435 [Candidatus Woesearchaeota archaeon]|nr:hypothetical protein [Candidatus Woesearchaeota archaeon]